jgi:hypothetical protein
MPYRPKAAKLVRNPRLREDVQDRLSGRSRPLSRLSRCTKHGRRTKPTSIARSTSAC